MKIFVTGPFRSGSTFLASLLNSQENIACFEDYPWRHFQKTYSSVEEFDCHCARIEARFLDLGIQAPELRSSENYQDSIDRYVNHLRELYSVNHIGFKSCMHPKQEIQNRIAEGYKVLIMRRNTVDILKSWLRRIDPSLADASVQLQDYYNAIDNYDLQQYAGQAMVIDFRQLINDTQDCLQQISKFLEIEIQVPELIYHSYARGRQEFAVNSSFQENSTESETELRSKLLVHFDEAMILDAARRIDSGSHLGLRPELKAKAKKLAYFIKRKLDSGLFQRVDW